MPIAQQRSVLTTSHLTILKLRAAKIKGILLRVGYILYAAGLLCLFKEGEEEGHRFLDGIAALVWGKDYEEMHRKLAHLMGRDGGVMEWATKHNCSFGLEKFKLVDFTWKWETYVDGGPKRKTRLATGKGVNVGSATVKPVPYARFLGVFMD